MNTFIERSNALLAARPDTTRVSTRYTHKNVVRKDATGGEIKPAVAVVKTYDPVSGTLYKFRVKRINELNRILRSLGPWPIESQENGAQVQKRGIASLMAATEYQEEKITDSQVDAKKDTKKDTKKKSKKGKK